MVQHSGHCGQSQRVQGRAQPRMVQPQPHTCSVVQSQVRGFRHRVCACAAGVAGPPVPVVPGGLWDWLVLWLEVVRLAVQLCAGLPVLGVLAGCSPPSACDSVILRFCNTCISWAEVQTINQIMTNNRRPITQPQPAIFCDCLQVITASLYKPFLGETMLCIQTRRSDISCQHQNTLEKPRHTRIKTLQQCAIYCHKACATLFCIVLCHLLNYKMAQRLPFGSSLAPRAPIVLCTTSHTVIHTKPCLHALASTSALLSVLLLLASFTPTTHAIMLHSIPCDAMSTPPLLETGNMPLDGTSNASLFYWLFRTPNPTPDQPLGIWFHGGSPPACTKISLALFCIPYVHHI